jgi:methylthioribose-1-phosphate isomerase
MRTLYWDNDENGLRVINQRTLPARLEYVTLHTCEEVVDAIRDMTVRGAPAIGAAAAFGLAMAARQEEWKDERELQACVEKAGRNLLATRPTAVNLSWAVRRMFDHVRQTLEDHPSIVAVRQELLDEAQRISDEDVLTNKKMAEYGASLIEDGDTIIHHCNTGSLATVDWGTALGVIRTAWEDGKKIHVLVDETRPRLQGARLTAWELEQYGIPYEIISDNMAGHFLAKGEVQKVIFGADRIAANGDVANKVGTYMLALAATDNNIPVYSVAPTNTIDMSIENGSMIPIEERGQEEVLAIQLHGERVTPLNAKARNPSFDITPSRLISAIVTEKGIARPPYPLSLLNLLSREIE